MTATIPPALAPYIQQCTDLSSFTLLTSVLDTPTNWLLTRFFTSASRQSSTDSHRILIVSLWRAFDLWEDLLQKQGINLKSAIGTSSVIYIDGLAVSAVSAQISGYVKLKGLTLKDLESALSSALQLSTKTADPRTTVLIDGLDFFLAVQPSPSSADVQRILLDLRSKVNSVVITCAADSALLHNTDPSATPLELEHSIFARSLAHQASWIFQLKPLETGQSKEVSGSIRASRGGAWDESVAVKVLEEAEWLFHQRSDGSVRVWGRGEA